MPYPRPEAGWVMWRFLFFFFFTFVVWLHDFSRAAEITAIPLNKAGEVAIFVEGKINYEDRELFLTKISPFQSGMVIFNSEGGSAIAGIEIGRAIRLRNFATWVPSGKVCASACAAAWLGGTHRYMGKEALIGFHSVFIIDGGSAKETGPGNALFGAYLAQLGLSDRAIVYLTIAGPDSMAWLTAARAESFGIKVAVYDEKTPKAEPHAPVTAEPLEGRARNFVIALNIIVSGTNEKLIPLLPGLYADPVNYYGQLKSRPEVISQIENFTHRWPNRSYAVQANSTKVVCDAIAQQCRVSGLIDFDAKNLETNKHSFGVASFDYLLSFRPNARWPLITSENGQVVNRKLEALINTMPEAPLSTPARRDADVMNR